MKTSLPLPFGIAALILLAGAHLAASAAPQYAFTDLGAPTPNQDASAVSITNFGQIAGYYVSDATGESVGLVFQADGAPPQELPTLGGEGCSPGAIAASGRVVGSSTTADGNIHAFLYAPSDATPMLDLGVLPGDVSSYATGINSSGEIVGYSEDPGGQPRAFRYIKGAAQPLQALNVPGSASSIARAIDLHGKVVGSYKVAGSTFAMAFRYIPGAPTVEDLGTLPGGQWSEAYATSGTGANIVGQANDSADQMRAFLYHNGKMENLGTLGDAHSIARGVNESGQAVGSVTGAASQAVLFLDGKVHALATLVPGLPAGWKLEEALAINELGKIVGRGTLNGQSRAFLLTPLPAQPTPIPSTAVAAPTLSVTGALKRETTMARITIKGSANGSVTGVNWRLGRNAWKPASLTLQTQGKSGKTTASWQFTARRLKPGRNRILVTATGLGGASAPARIIVIRK